ncbi:MAG TPA: DUF58 domain-containing protein [Thermomicrobiales bacterium]|nr:DUF58 domain-containing protein [Thermomicrobiales bacterium]
MQLVPTRKLLLLALFAALPLLVATIVPAFLIVAIACFIGLIALALWDALHAPGHADFLVSREYDARLSLAESNPVWLRVVWTSADRFPARALRLLVRDETPPGIPTDHEPFAGEIAPGGAWSGGYHLRPLRRGDYPFGRIVLRVESLIGLFMRQLSYPGGDPARVYPNLRAIRRYDMLARRGRLHEAGLRRTRLRGSGTEFERLRDYLPDDDFRRINWKATARRRQPVTTEYETERSQNLVIALDTGRLMGTPIQGMIKLDYAINSALLLAYVAMEMGDRTGLLAFADRVGRFTPLARGQRQLQLMIEQLYNVGSQPVESDQALALRFLAGRQLKRSLIVLFTDLSESADQEPFVAALGLLARRHLPVCVMASNPDIVRLAAAAPTDMRQAYEKVVAQRLLDERRTLIDRLERQGSLVIDVPAEQLTTSIVNRYLEIKARAQL